MALDAPTHALSLVLVPQAGWQVFVVKDMQSFGPINIRAKQAESLGRAFGDVLPTEFEPSPFQVVREGTSTRREAIERRLQEAEQVAQSIPALRKALQEASDG